jgi:hypothetical protein
MRVESGVRKWDEAALTLYAKIRSENIGRMLFRNLPKDANDVNLASDCLDVSCDRHNQRSEKRWR